MDEHETKAKYNLAESCCSSISLNQLQALSESPTTPILSMDPKMTYGEINGLQQLRVNLANLYSSKTGKWR